jgi:acetyl esterase/lipase
LLASVPQIKPPTLCDVGADHAGDVLVARGHAGRRPATALRARSEGLPLPAALVGISGAYDLNPTGNAAHANATADPVLMAVVQILFVIFPARAELSGLPPVLLVASSSEILYRDSEDLTQLLASAGVACPLQVWDRQLHVFQAWAG